jgi:glucose-6-phosphate isomerase
MSTPQLRHQPAYSAVADHHAAIAGMSLRTMFADDPDRSANFGMQGCGWHLDVSRNLITSDTLALLFSLAQQCGLPDRITDMFAGAPVNTTEGRAALHVALRMPRNERLVVDGVDVVAQVHEVLDHMASFATAVRSGTWTGFTGHKVRHVVNIGIGGSDLGPVMACGALAPYADSDISMHFVSNVDDNDLGGVLRTVDPACTLFIVASKSFTTSETMANARSARRWLVEALGDEAAVARHMVAVSTNAEAVAAFGIDTGNMFGFWDWVGGRYSLASAIGLSTMIAVGPDNHADMLAGMHAMDEHFRTEAWPGNLPVVMGMLGVWYRNFFHADTTGVMPYDARLARFPAYVQQLAMESNGKRVTVDGDAVDHATAAVVWGEPGTNGQHSFFQLLHQGTMLVPVDFIVVANSPHPMGSHRDLLVANALAQSAALAFGRTADEVADAGTRADLVAHKVMPGNRPSNMLMAAELTPYSLGALVALYEHVVFTQAVVWGVNPFDQWGVELGKDLAGGIAAAINGDDTPQLDPSTAALVSRYLALRRDELRRD